MSTGFSKDLSIDVLVESKKTYLEVFKSKLKLPIYKLIENIFQDSIDYIEKHPEAEEGVLYEFQSGLKDIRKWNDEEISNAINKIISPSGSNSIESSKRLDDLLEAVIISHVKIMTAISLNNKRAPLDLTIPTIKRFLYDTLLECARRFYENPYLMDTRSSVDPIEKQKNLEKSYQVISTAIQTTITNSIPTDEILSKALEPPQKIQEDDQISMYTSASDANEKKNNSLRVLIRKELDQMLAEYGSDSEGKRSKSPEPNDGERSVSTERQGDISYGSDKKSESDKNSVSSSAAVTEKSVEKVSQNSNDEGIKDIIVPASTRFATRKMAQEKMDKVKDKNFDSDTVFFSDSE